MQRQGGRQWVGPRVSISRALYIVLALWLSTLCISCVLSWFCALCRVCVVCCLCALCTFCAPCSSSKLPPHNPVHCPSSVIVCTVNIVCIFLHCVQCTWCIVDCVLCVHCPGRLLGLDGRSPVHCPALSTV